MDQKKLAAWRAIEDQLEAGDILLFHHNKGLGEWLIRKRTGSYWNHSALVFKPKKELVFGGPLIVEAGGQDISANVEMHQMKRYTENFDLYDVGVMRYPNLTDVDRRNLVTNFMLDNIDLKYDYIRVMALYVDKFILRILKPITYAKFLRRVINPGSVVCSTFVHKAFHLVDTSPHNYGGTLSGEGEEMFSPGDLAASDHFVWIYNKHA
jgi:hypothetical protein